MNDGELLYRQALERLRQLIDEALARGIEDPHSASLATADSSARPSVRTIYVVAVEEAGLLFFANLKSGKGRQLQENPQAALCFFWPALQEQVLIEGAVVAQSAEASDHYWRRRPREAQLAAWASDQSGAAQSPQAREQARHREQGSGFEPIARHSDWVAFRLQPERIDFWPSGWQRLRERVRYQQDADGRWSKLSLNP